MKTLFIVLSACLWTLLRAHSAVPKFHFNEIVRPTVSMIKDNTTLSEASFYKCNEIKKVKISTYVLPSNPLNDTIIYYVSPLDEKHMCNKYQLMRTLYKETELRK